MRNSRVNVWVAALVICGFATLGWQRVEASSPQPAPSAVTIVRALAGHGDMQYKVVAYESKLHGYRPMGPTDAPQQASTEDAKAKTPGTCGSCAKGARAEVTPSTWDGNPADVMCSPAVSGDHSAQEPEADSPR